MTTSLLIPFIHLSSHMKTQASTVDGKAYVSSELHKKGDLPKFLILGLIFFPQHINGKETRIKLIFAFFSAEEEWYSMQQSPTEAEFSKEIGFMLPAVFRISKPSRTYSSVRCAIVPCLSLLLISKIAAAAAS